MKKITLLILVLSVLSGTALYSIDLSAGAGIVIIPRFTSIEILGVNVRDTNIGFGVKGFLDATYVEASVGFQFFDSTSTLALSAHGKFPIDLNQILLFPLAGITYTTVDERLWIDAGVGVDYNLSPSLYLRGNGIFGYGLKTSLEKLAEDLTDSSITTTRVDIGVSVGFRF